MSIAPVCNACGKELEEPGGLIFTPPSPGGGCFKFHICVGCMRKIRCIIEER